jgi:hypothetical protein
VGIGWKDYDKITGRSRSEERSWRLSIRSSRIRPCTILRRHRSCSGKRNLDTQRGPQRPFCLDRHMASTTRELANRSCRRRLCADQGLGLLLEVSDRRNRRFQNKECIWLGLSPTGKLARFWLMVAIAGYLPLRLICRAPCIKGSRFPSRQFHSLFARQAT